jgi:thiopurine S-methyltransferase
VNPEFWLERWKNSQIGFHQPEFNSALQLHWPTLGLPADATVFVPLCGKSRDMLWLRAAGHAVIGIELIQIAVREFFTENGLTPTVTPQPPFERWEAGGISILCGDFFGLQARDLERVAGVYDRASLIAWPRDMRQRYIDKLCEILPPTAATLLVTLSYPDGEMQGPPFAVAEPEVRALYADQYDVTRLATQDVLDRNSSLRQRGLTQLAEQVYRIRRKRS